MREAADMPLEYPDAEVEKLFQFVMSMIPGKEALDTEKNYMLWNPIFNYVVTSWIVVTVMVGKAATVLQLIVNGLS